jgi:esterase
MDRDAKMSRTSVEVAHTRVGDEGQPLIVLHGLFGAGSNWRTIAHGLKDCRSVYLLDARNHGRSPHTPITDYATMAADVAAFMDRHSIASADILGHSMGGKTAMHLALNQPERVSRLLVVDIVPAPSPNDYQPLIDALLALPIEQFTRRSEAAQILARSVADPGLRTFLLQNLSSTANGFEWRINLTVLRDCIPALLAFDCESSQCFAGPTAFIRGARSEYVTDEAHRSRISELFPKASIHTVLDAGHWVHAEQPALFLQAARSFLQCPDYDNR